MNRTFDRVIRFDDRSRQYAAVTDLLKSYPLRSYTWSCGLYNDQGQEGACVGFAFGHELTARPNVIPTTAHGSRNIYLAAKTMDEWEGEDYEGTSVLAGAKATKLILNAYGKSVMPEYRWAFGVEDVVRVLGYRGPVVLGTYWYEGMYNTDARGMIHPSGNIVGGHAYLARGVTLRFKAGTTAKTMANIDPHASTVLIHNSWGTDWGGHRNFFGLRVEGGCARISLYNLDVLLRQDGEACIPVVRG